MFCLRSTREKHQPRATQHYLKAPDAATCKRRRAAASLTDGGNPAFRLAVASCTSPLQNWTQQKVEKLRALAAMLLTVTVPDGLMEGDVMSIEHLGAAYEIAVPPGCSGGMPIEIDLPGGDDGGTSQQPPPSDGMLQPVEVVVPDGTFEGMAFSVDFGGTIYEIVCPDGCGPGSAIVVELPAAPPAAPAPPARLPPVYESDGPRRPPPPPPPEDPEDAAKAAAMTAEHYKFKPGQRVELYRSDGAESPGYIVCGFEGVFDVLYKVKLDNGLYKEAVPEEDISAQVTGDVGDLFDGWG